MKTHAKNTSILAASILAVALASPLQADAAAPQAERKVIRVARGGSSSFSGELMEQVKRIAEASGKYTVASGSGDGLGYMRLDTFASSPGAYEAWLEKYFPRLEKGRYDFVVIQTLGWHGLLPEHQQDLCERILPDLARRLRPLGTRIVLYDRYASVDGWGSKPESKRWGGRYPEAERLCYLLHIQAAKLAGFDQISFAGEAVNRLRGNPLFKDARILYDTGHPGVFANYASAVVLASLLTGEDYADSPVRTFPLQGFEDDFFAKLRRRGGSHPFLPRYSGKEFTLTDEEAAVLRTAALASHRQWNALLRQCLADEAAYGKVAAEIRFLQGEREQYEKYGLDPKYIAKKREAYAASAHEGLDKGELRTLTWKNVSINHVHMPIRYFASDHLTKDEANAMQRASVAFWDDGNAKFIEDVKLAFSIKAAQHRARGERDELKRLGPIGTGLHQVYLVSVSRTFLKELDEPRARIFMQKIKGSGVTKQHAPALHAYEQKHLGDRDALVAGWDAYLTAWKDPDFLDRFKADDYADAAAFFPEADRLFKARIEALGK